jgi:hypothetical protein
MTYYRYEKIMTTLSHIKSQRYLVSSIFLNYHLLDHYFHLEWCFGTRPGAYALGFLILV